MDFLNFSLFIITYIPQIITEARSSKTCQVHVRALRTPTREKKVDDAGIFVLDPLHVYRHVKTLAFETKVWN